MASYVDITNTLNFAVSFKPTSAFPLDARSMFGSYQAAAAAAATAENAGSTNTIYYYGQTLTVFENDVIVHYTIQPDNTLKAIGAAIAADNKSITINDEVIGLKSFGTKYFKFINKDNIVNGTGHSFPDNMPTANANDYTKINDVWYKYHADTGWAVADTEPVTSSYYELTNGWKAGLEPRVVQSSEGEFELAWYEPYLTTMEGLQDQVSSIETSLESIDNKFTNTTNDISNRLDTVSDTVDILNADASTEGSVKNQISTAISTLMDNPDEAMNSIKELVDWANDHASDALTLSNNVTANTTAINAINTLLGTSLPDSTSATTVIDYITEVATSVNNLGTAASKDVEFFATAAQGAKADTAVQSVTKGSTNGHILVDGNDVEVYTAPKASVTEAGVIKVDGSSIGTNSEGVASVVAVDYTKVTGLSTQLTNTKNEAVEESKTYTDDNFVAKVDIAGTDNVSGSIETASNGKVISEKLFLEALSWKTIM